MAGLQYLVHLQKCSLIKVEKSKMKKMRNMTEKWNIKVLTTVAESPSSKGVCEKKVGIIKESWNKLKEEEGELMIPLKWVWYLQKIVL